MFFIQIVLLTGTNSQINYSGGGKISNKAGTTSGKGGSGTCTIGNISSGTFVKDE